MTTETAAVRRRPERRGFAPSVLLAQVRNTAGWALDTAAADGWRDVLVAAPALDATWREPEALVPYLRVLLAAHYASVATLVPTDVDTHIRHHVWQEIDERGVLEAALDAVDEAAAWNPRPVSARVVELAGVGAVHGHAGEWLSVRAGALGRALTLGLEDLADRLLAAIDAELAHEAAIFGAARASGEASLALRVATTLAHNGGDLSRVIEALPPRTPRRAELIGRFARLGHEGPERYGGEHLLAGRLNKAVMATENHRFLPLREARGLRTARALVVPIAPFFDGWGERVAVEPALDARAREDVVDVLLGAHAAAPTLASYARALAGIDRATRGGLERLTHALPARTRKVVSSPPLREALRTPTDRFEAKMASAYRHALASARVG